ncbi:hypothetical protein EDD86DRAFT_243989 [Gorgonomyces haynaldii]|nr:hypothetical protein EDD86DRAFT_243989 [Gorgonomyces haynaldii]
MSTLEQAQEIVKKEFENKQSVAFNLPQHRPKTAIVPSRPKPAGFQRPVSAPSGQQDNKRPQSAARYAHVKSKIAQYVQGEIDFKPKVPQKNDTPEVFRIQSEPFSSGVNATLLSLFDKPVSSIFSDDQSSTISSEDSFIQPAHSIVTLNPTTMNDKQVWAHRVLERAQSASKRPKSAPKPSRPKSAPFHVSAPREISGTAVPKSPRPGSGYVSRYAYRVSRPTTPSETQSNTRKRPTSAFSRFKSDKPDDLQSHAGTVFSITPWGDPDSVKIKTIVIPIKTKNGYSRPAVTTRYYSPKPKQELINDLKNRPVASVKIYETPVIPTEKPAAIIQVERKVAKPVEKIVEKMRAIDLQPKTDATIVIPRELKKALPPKAAYDIQFLDDDHFEHKQWTLSEDTVSSILQLEKRKSVKRVSFSDEL